MDRRVATVRSPRTPRTPRTPRWLDVLDIVAFSAVTAAIAWVFSTRLSVQFTLPKLFWLHAALPIVVTIWALRHARGQTRALPWSVLVSSLALAIWWVVTTATAIDTRIAVLGAYGRFNGLITHLICMVLFWVAASSGFARPGIERRVRILVVMFLPVAIYALVQYVGWDVFVWPNLRPASTIGQPVPLAALLGLCVPFALSWMLASGGPTRALAAAASASLVIAVATTLSRAPAAGTALAIAIVAFAAVRERGVTVRAVVASVGVAAIAAVAVLMLSTGGWGGFVARFVTPMRDPSFTNRFVYYRVAAHMAADRPVTGSGFETYGLLYPRYFTGSPNGVGVDEVPTMVHSGYLHMVVANGFPVLVLYLAFCGAVLALLVRAYRSAADASSRIMCAAFVGAIVGFLVQDVTGWLEVSLSVFFWIICGLAVAYCVAEQGSNAVVARRRAVRRAEAVAAALVSVAAGLILSARTAQTIEADALVFAASRADVDRDWPAAREALTRALMLVPDEARLWDSAATVYLKRADAASDRAAYSEAARALAAAHRLNPYDSYALIHRVELDVAAVRRGLIQTASGEAEDAIRLLAAHDRNHTVAHAAIARLRLAERHVDAALAALERARAIDPQTAGLDALEGDIRRAAGDRAAAIAAYRRELTRLGPSNPEWLATRRKLVLNLLESGRKDEAAAEADAVLAAYPDDAVTHQMLRIARP